MIYLLLLSAVLLQASADGLFDNGLKKISKPVKLLSVFVLIYLTEFDSYWVDVLALYVCIRGYAFDLMYNVVRRLPIDYSGTTTPVYDYLMSKIKGVSFWVYRLFWVGVSLLVYFLAIR